MYNKQEVAKRLEITLSTVITYIRRGKLIPNKEGLFDEQQIHNIRTYKLGKAVNIIRANRPKILAMIKEGHTYDEISQAFNISLTSIATYFKGESLHANSAASYPPRLAKEYRLPANYNTVLEAFSIARQSK